MSAVIELKPIEGETCLYDENGRFLGKYNPATGRGMFAHTFFVDERISEGQMQRAYRLALEEIAEISGTCPYDAYDFKCNCEERCEAGDEIIPSCWAMYFEAKAVSECCS